MMKFEGNMSCLELYVLSKVQKKLEEVKKKNDEDLSRVFLIYFFLS